MSCVIVNPETRKTKPAPQLRTTRSRTALCEALLALLEDKSLDQITIREITDKARVGYATFFRHYEDKETLLHDMAAQEIEKLLDLSLPILNSEDSRASTEAQCAYVWTHQSIWRALLTGGAAAALKEEYLRRALELVQEYPSGKGWLPSELAVTFSVTSMLEILTWWLKQTDNPLPIEEVSNIIDKLCITPIYPSNR